MEVIVVFCCCCFDYDLSALTDEFPLALSGSGDLGFSFENAFFKLLIIRLISLVRIERLVPGGRAEEHHFTQ